jgi:hypothetical protein
VPNFIRWDKRVAPSRTEPFVTVQKRGLFSMNKAALELLGNPEALELLFDPDEQIIGFRGVDKGKRYAVPVRKQARSNSYLVGGQAFTKHFGIDTNVSRRFEAEMVEDVLAVDLQGGGVEATPGRRTKDRDGGKS